MQHILTMLCLGMENLTYSIQMVSKLTDISIYTLRTWEKRYQVVVPKRSTNGRREFSEDDVEMLWLLGDLVKLGFQIGSITAKTKSQLEKIYFQHTGKKFNPKKETKLILKNDEGYQQAQFILINALETYQLDIITKELFKLSKLLNPKQFAIDILSPLMQKIGMKVMNGDLSISQEHALSALIKFQIGSMLFNPKNDRKRKITKVLLTTPSDELHEFGIIVASLLCHHYSLEFMFLGANLPSDALVDTIKSTDYDLIILGSTYKSTRGQKARLTEYIDELMLQLSKKKKVLIGGPRQVDEASFKNNKNLYSLESFNELDSFLAKLK